MATTTRGRQTVKQDDSQAADSASQVGRDRVEELARTGAREMLMAALTEEVDAYLERGRYERDGQAQHPLQSQGAGSILLAGHPPDRPKPQGKGHPRPLEDRACRCRSLVSAAGTHPAAATGGPIHFAVTSRANEPLGPAQRPQVLTARFFRREPSFQLHLRTRVVFHTLNHYRLWVLESRGYPLLLITKSEKRMANRQWTIDNPMVFAIPRRRRRGV